MSGLAVFVAAARRRLRRTWVIATLQWLAPGLGAGALALVLLGRRIPEPWPEPAAAALVAFAAVAVVALGRIVRIPDAMVARAVDRRLDTKDALATALEVPPGSSWGDRVQRRATLLIAGVPTASVAPIALSARRTGLSATLAVVALALAVAPNHQHDVRRQREADAAAIEAVADGLREEADALVEEPTLTPAERAAAEALRALADQLDAAEGIDEARQALENARAELAAGVDDDLLAQKAAVHGLDRSLEARPLPGAAGAVAADQLEQAADALDGLPPDQQAALADRLEQLAEAQSLGNPAAARALRHAAAGLRSGDVAGARAALGEAAQAQRSASAALSEQEARQAAAGAAARALGRLGAGGSGTGEQAQAAGMGGEGQGQGQGDGDGKGQGDGDGKGQGGGAGSSPGGNGSPSGVVAGAPGGTGRGQGGPGQSGAGGPDPAGSSTAEPTVFDPAFAQGEDLNAQGSGTGEPGETIGRGNGRTTAGQSRTPLSQALARYRGQTTRAVERGDLPPSLRDVIQAYFDRLSGD